MENTPKELSYLFVLKALNEIPFNVGKKLLIDFLQGKKGNKTISRNRLHIMNNFGNLAYADNELNAMIDNLILNGMIQIVSLGDNRFVKLLGLSAKGRKEIKNPELYKRKLSFGLRKVDTVITDEDKRLFREFGDFLFKFNDEQKKSITSTSKHILCIAGAGSGKTTALTKRIEFLIKYRSANPNKILAITFTRKARQEMIERLSGIEKTGEVRIETFNSFCEKILKRYNDLIYDKKVRVIGYLLMRLFFELVDSRTLIRRQSSRIWFGSKK